jgi:hypothetical protein
VRVGRSRTAEVPTPRAPATPDDTQRCTANASSTGARCRGWRTAGFAQCARHHRPDRTTTVTGSVATVQLDGVAWQTWRFGSSAWQGEAWRLYDITGQLRFVANWVGNSVSRCRLYVAEVDDAGEPGEEASDPEVAALASGPLGSGPAKDEALRLLGINLFVPGEAYIVAEADAGPNGTDRWFVVSGRQIKRTGNQVIVRRPQLHGGDEMLFRQDVDLILRVWTPHPDDADEPDSPTRSAIPDLREIEAIRKRKFAEYDSRLLGAGLLPLPDGVEFPRGDDDDAGVQGFTQMLMRAMATSLRDRSSAEAMVPIAFTVPGEYLDKIKQVTFWSEMSAQLLPLGEAAVRSLAQSLDIPPEILLGQADSNHWTAWQTSADAVTTQIVPVNSRICDALTNGYLIGALEALGKDPTRYVYALDVAPLTTATNRAADALNYHGAGLISDAAAVEAGAFRKDQMPDEAERLRRLATVAIMSNPSLLADPALRKLVGIAEPPPQALYGQPYPGAGPPTPSTTDAPPAPAVSNPQAIPTPTPQTEQTAPAARVVALTAVSNLVTRRALTLAGSRLVPHTQRDRWPGCPRHQLHTRHGPVTREQADRVLRGAWDDLDAVAADIGVDAAQLGTMLHGFAAELLTRGMAYDQVLLADLIERAVRGHRLDHMAELAGAAA